jgi:glycosyltransferase involved in cell wall biosynthesis
MHPAEMKEMGLSAQKLVKREFLWDMTADKYDKVYQEVISHG